MKLGSSILLAVFLAVTMPVQPAKSEVDIKTPWADIYVGPEGLFVNGPWGRVEVPASERDRVCREWRKSVEKHYEDQKCEVEFDRDGCTIEEIECER